MYKTFEIYLTKKHITREEWIDFINIISLYNGFFKRWKIVVFNENNKLRYFVQTRCSLPASINNLNSFLLKPCDNLHLPIENQISFSIPKIGSSIVDIINYNEIKNKGDFKYLEITIRKLYQDKIKTRVSFFLEKNNVIKKYIAFLTIAGNLLSVDFDKEKRFFYKSTPKYLDISKILHLVKSEKTNALLKIDTFPYLQGDFYIDNNSFTFNKHSIIMGSSGCGKSKFISSFINNIYKNDYLRQLYRVVVIDPHAALEEDIGGIGKVLDFKRKIDSIDLFINSNDDIVASVELLLDLFKSLISDSYNSKLERVLRHSISLLLADKKFNFTNLRKLLLDIDFRNDLLKKVKEIIPISVVDFFLVDFNDLKTKSYTEAISPIIAFIDEMEMIPVFNGDGGESNLSDTINDNFLTLFSLNRTKLGDKVTKTIAGLVMGQLFTIIEQRKIDKHIIFIIDEVSVVENPILAKYLSEARKYNLSLVLAGQYFNQISDYLKNAIFANVSNYFTFRVSKLDANILVDNFNMKIPVDDSREKKVKLLTELSNRECIVRVESNGVLLPAFKAKTIDYVSIPRVINNDVEVEKGMVKEKPVNKKIDFKSNTKISLKDILVSSSTNKGGV